MTNPDLVFENLNEGTDTIKLIGVNPSDVRMWADGSGNLNIQYSTTDSIYIYGGFDYSTQSSLVNKYIERIAFDNGTVWNLATGMTMTDTDDTHQIYGSLLGDTIDGRGGNDSINGGSGNDTLYGGQGNDYLQGGAGDDYLNGGQGQNTLDGGDGNDTADYSWVTSGFAYDAVAGTVTHNGYTDYLYNIENVIAPTAASISNTYTVSSGTLNVNETGGNDLLVLGGSLTPESLTFTNSGTADLAITATGLSVTLQNQRDAVASHHVETLTFTDGFALPLDRYTAWTFGTSAIDAMYGDAGGAKDDVMLGRDGNDVLKGYNNNDILSGDAGNDKLYGGNGNDILHGGSGADQLFGEANDDTLFGGTGDDLVYGGTGNDNYIWSAGMGADTVTEETGAADRILVGGNLMPENLTFSTVNGTDLKILSSLAASDSLTLINQLNAATPDQRVESLTFTDGFALPLDRYSSWTYGTSGADAIYGDVGGAKDDVMLGGAGNDSLKGYNGNDILSGDAGNDKLYGSNGNDLLHGGSGADQLLGEANDDTLYGGADNDILTGGTGADRFVFETGGGVDTVADFTTAQGDILDVHGLLTGYDPLASAISDFVQINDSGANSIVSVDADGAANGSVWVQIATLTGVTGLTDEAALIASGNLMA